MWDPVGKLMTDMRSSSDVAAIVGEHPHEPKLPRVRSPQPGAGDAQGPGKYRAFVVVVTMATPRHPSVPIQRTRHLVTCYGRDPEEAALLYAACSTAIHHQGPRQTTSGNAIYVSHDDTGGAYGEDPDTKQPYYSFVIESLATTQAVAP